MQKTYKGKTALQILKNAYEVEMGAGNQEVVNDSFPDHCFTAYIDWDREPNKLKISIHGECVAVLETTQKADKLYAKITGCDEF